MIYDLMIIGAGPAGYVAAERAGAKGLSVVLFEDKALGGVCLNEGCIPTKTLLYSAKVLNTAQHSKGYGINVGDVAIDYGKIMARKESVVRRLVGGIKAKMRAGNVEVVSGFAKIVSHSDEIIRIGCNDMVFEGKNVLISTGSKAFIPQPWGAEVSDVLLTNREILALKQIPESLIVIGGGVMGMEFASFFNSMGSKVTVIDLMEEILPGTDSEIASMLRDLSKKRGIDFLLSCSVSKVKGNTLFYRTKEGVEESISAEKIFIGIGRKPNIEGLEEIGIELDRGAVKVDQRMRTNLKNVYAAGDCTAKLMLAHVASAQGEVVVNNILGKDDTMIYNAVPGVIYTNPEIASVGLTAAQATAKNIKCHELKLPMAYSGRFVAENEAGVGVCKLIVESETDRVIGAHIMGNPAGEIIWGMALALQAGLTREQMEKIVFPHPTVSEIIKECLFE